MSRSSPVTRLLPLVAAFVACAAVAASTTQAQKEIATAKVHATVAAQIDTLDGVHLHLHHVINCLVGPKGTGFDTAAGDPCKDHGNGAIPDATGDKPLQGRLRAALADAEAGLKAESLHAIGQDAGKAAAGLQAAPAASGSSSSW